MAENVGKWPFKRGPMSNIRHRMAAEGIQFPWRWNGGTILPNLDVIWDMSVKGGPQPKRTDLGRERWCQRPLCYIRRQPG